MSKHSIENATLPFKELQKKVEQEKLRRENPFKAFCSSLIDSTAKDFKSYYMSNTK